MLVGCKKGVLKYIDLNRNKMVSIVTDHEDIIADILCIEKLRISEKEADFFHKNINLVLVGSKKLGIYNGYGNLLFSVTPVNAEDFSASPILPGKNLCLLKVGR